MCYGSHRATAFTKHQRKASVIQFVPNGTAVSQQFTASWTRSIKAASPANPAHSALSRHAFTHTFPASASHCCQVCYVFPVREEGIWAGVQADYQPRTARAEDKKQHIQTIFTPPLSFLPAAFPHPVFTHSFHFNACALFRLHFPKELRPHQL